MNKSITQANQNDKQISKSIKRFFTRCYWSDPDQIPLNTE